MKITVRSKGTANDDWVENVIEVESMETAQAEVDKIWGIERNKKGEQTNADSIQVEIVE